MWWIVGRDLIHCNEELVLPTEVEKVLGEMEGVAEVTVIGVKDPEKGEVPRAYVVKEENSSTLRRMSFATAGNVLREHQLMEVAFVDMLPRNSLGMVTKYVLREHGRSDQDRRYGGIKQPGGRTSRPAVACNFSFDPPDCRFISLPYSPLLLSVFYTSDTS